MKYEVRDDGEYSIVTMFLDDYNYIFYYKPNKHWDDNECIHCRKNIHLDKNHYILEKTYPEITISITKKGNLTPEPVPNSKDEIFHLCERCYNTHIQDKTVEGFLGFISLLKVKKLI